MRRLSPRRGTQGGVPMGVLCRGEAARRRLRIGAIGGVALLFSALVSNCSSGASVAGAGKSPINIVLSAPFSGSVGYIGLSAKDGVDYALKTEGSTINGRAVHITTQDDECAPSTATQL